ncbi:MAG: valine--tRNA ligase [Leptospirales bacterium]
MSDQIEPTENFEEQIPKTYDPIQTEEKWLERDGKKSRIPRLEAPSFSMVIPPPNITGRLHMGHALNITLQDVIARFRKMEGHDVLWIPGTDHAGIATQNVVEKRLSQEGVALRSLTRERFIDRVWEWKDSIKSGVLDQITRLGASLSWDHERFTMDEGFSRAVSEVFVQLYREGLVYRGERMIHWCPRCLTALSDVEVTYVDRPGTLYFVRYQESPGRGRFLTVATTRPETIFADQALAVHPEDSRYSDWIGKKVFVPLIQREIPVIADPSVDREFGTGVLKVTPSHSMADWEIAGRHGLEPLEIIDHTAMMNDRAGPLKGLSREEARERMSVELSGRDFLEREETYSGAVGVCYRCQTTIEPRLSLQWFVRMGELAKPAIEAVREGTIRFYPDGWKNTYFEWLENIRDWCVSRQIWWGHSIPAWHCKVCTTVNVATARPQQCSQCGSVELAPDPDVLDTWFSSALWPFVTLGWPERTADLERFYPTSLLVTGFDILFFWVARMVMMGYHFTGKPPFKDVYIHALVRDQYGQKMTKSRGNVVDPLEIMDRYGTDSFRMTLVHMASPGRDIRLSTERVEGFRNFVSKIWNAFRFIDRFAPETPDSLPFDLGSVQGAANRWILNSLVLTVQDMRRYLSIYRFDEAANTLYHFTWHLFCDWYIEASKAAFDRPQGDVEHIETARTIRFCGSVILRMAHPIMPFVTRELWEILYSSESPLEDQTFPDFPGLHPETEGSVREFESLMALVGGIRQVRSQLKLNPSVELAGHLVVKSQMESRYKSHLPFISRMARVRPLDVIIEGQDQIAGLQVPFSDGVLCLDLTGIVDYGAEEKRLSKELDRVRQKKESILQRLKSREFRKKAPPEVIEKDERLLLETEEEGAGLENALMQLRDILSRRSGQ